jgi:D-glucosaminate-6-phosphate ammonia-lyase
MEYRPKRIINTCGNWSLLGGTICTPQVKAAMSSVHDGYYDVEEIDKEISEQLALIFGTEDALVTSGCSAALALGAAGFVSRDDVSIMRNLPYSEEIDRAILIQNPQRYEYDRCLEFCGAQVIGIGNREYCNEQMIRNLIRSKIGAVGMAYYVNRDNLNDYVGLDTYMAIAHDAGLPVIVDACAEIYPLDHIIRIANMGDITCFSGKYFGAPQSTGFMVGKKEWVGYARKNSFVNFKFETGEPYAIGRSMKYDVSEAVGLLAGVEHWFKQDHNVRLQAIEARLRFIANELSSLSNVFTVMRQSSRHFVHFLHLECLPSCHCTVFELCALLKQGNPSIKTFVKDNALWIHGHSMSDEDAVIFAQRTKEILNA